MVCLAWHKSVGLLCFSGEKKEEKKDDKNTVTIIDNRSGKSYTLAVWNGTINAEKLSAVGGLR
jgi:hypothetical protein